MNVDVIIVDDDAVVLFLHKILVQKAGYASNLYDFQNAEEALEFISQRKDETPLLILLDINMPLLDGWEFLGFLSEFEKSEKIYVAMITSSINTADKIKALNYPEVFAFLEKPLTSENCRQLFRDIEKS